MRGSTNNWWRVTPITVKSRLKSCAISLASLPVPREFEVIGIIHANVNHPFDTSSILEYNHYGYMPIISCVRASPELRPIQSLHQTRYSQEVEMSKIFVRERQNVGQGAGRPRFAVVAVEGMDLKVYTQHIRKIELETLAEAVGAEIVYLPAEKKPASRNTGKANAAAGAHSRNNRFGQATQAAHYLPPSPPGNLQACRRAIGRAAPGVAAARRA